MIFYVLANLAQVVVWRVYDPEHFFWPLWSIVFWGIGLAFHAWAVYSPPTSNARR
nr:2TM domain-containing protein [Streptosporangium sp. 'caverna']